MDAWPQYVYLRLEFYGKFSLAMCLIHFFLISLIDQQGKDKERSGGKKREGFFFYDFISQM